MPCFLGEHSIHDTINGKREGDKTTPRGILRAVAVFYRPDCLPRPHTLLPILPITRRLGWCDDTASPLYNRLMRRDDAQSMGMDVDVGVHHEPLMRDDELYDMLIVTDYNRHPVMQDRGSAIFIHLTKESMTHTKGCIAMDFDDLSLLLSDLSSNNRLIIHGNPRPIS